MADPNEKKNKFAKGGFVNNSEKSVAEQRREEADKGVLGRVDTPSASTAGTSTIKGLKGEDIKVSDPLVTTSLKKQKAQEEAARVENTIKDTYNTSMMDFGAKISEMEEAKKKAKEQDATAQRRARSMSMIAGISDGLASLANLIGVSKGASNVQVGSALTPLEKKMEAARLERKADIKSIDDRLEQYLNQLNQVRMQKGAALASYQQNKENQAFQKSMQEGAQAFQERLANLGHTRNLETMAKQQEFQKTMQENAQAFTAEQNKLEWDAKKEIAENNNFADITKTQIRYGKSGKQDTTQFVFDDPVTGKMRSIDLSNQSITNILATYLPKAIERGEITEEEAEDAKNFRSNEVSKTNLLGMVNKSTVMRLALLTAVGESADNPVGVKPQVSTPVADFQTSGENSSGDPSWAQGYTQGQK